MHMALGDRLESLIMGHYLENGSWRKARDRGVRALLRVFMGTCRNPIVAYFEFSLLSTLVPDLQHL